MKRLIFLGIIFTALSQILCSCSKEDAIIPPHQYEKAILGYWNFEDANTEHTIYKHAEDFSNTPGFKFLEDGRIIDRKNIGFCGTPPITYQNYTGTWEFIDENTIQVVSHDWTGEVKFKIYIKELNETFMSVKIEYEISL
jgi:hypothetical protein